MPFRITSYHLQLHFITPFHTKTLKIEAFAFAFYVFFKSISLESTIQWDCLLLIKLHAFHSANASIFIVFGTGSAGTSNLRRVATGGHDQEFSPEQLKVRLLSHSLYACHEKNVHIKTGNSTF